MSTTYARTLIVAADVIGAPSATGITLDNLFGAWPEDRLAQVYTARPSAQSKYRLYRMPDFAAPMDAVARRLLQRTSQEPSGPAPIAGVPLGPGADPSARLHAEMRATADLSPLLLPRAMKAFVKDFRPEVIYSPLGSVRIMKLALRAAQLSGAPLVPHFMDDWPNTLYSSGELGGLALCAQRKWVTRVTAPAPFGMGIGSEMCEAYERQFGRPFFAFMNPVEWRPVQEPTADDLPVELLYVGGLHLGRWEALLSLAQSIHEKDLSARLVVYAPRSHLAAAEAPPRLSPVLTVAGNLGADQVAQRLQEADILVHVESQDPALSAYTKLSVSTKIPQYMLASRPILAIGPTGLSSMRLIDRASAGLVTEARTIAAPLEALVSSRSLRASLGRNGRAWAEANFTAAQVRRRFQSALEAGALRRAPEPG